MIAVRACHAPRNDNVSVQPHTQSKWVNRSECPPIARWFGARESVSYHARNAIWFCVGRLEKQSPVLIRHNRTQNIIGVHMKKIILATLLAGIGSTAALAADMGGRTPYTKAPAMMAPVASWSGFYIGGNVGYGWGDGGSHAVFPPTDFAFLDASLNTKPKGVIGGGQIGYNWQTDSLLIGLEADLQGSGMKGTASQSPLLVPNGSPDLQAGTSVDSKLSWFGTVRGRIGVTVTPDLLLYGTGGLAYGSVSASQAAFENTVNFATSASTNQTVTGWAAGAGAEWMLAHNWSVKAEYLHVDLGLVSTTSLVVGNASHPVFSTVDTKAHYDIVRAGVNYHF
jgi:outer membrane immunogenic protein